VIFSILTLFWQIFVLFACCSGLGLAFRFLLPKEFSLLNKVLFSLMGGFFLVVLVPQNLVYLGMPVRISAWLILAAALTQVWLSRRNFLTRIRTFHSNAETRTLAVVALLTVTFHGIVPIQQGLNWYYGKAYEDQLYYVVLAEFLKEESYSTREQDIGLRPWLVGAVGYRDTAEQLGLGPGPGLELIGSKKQRIGESIITAEMSVWSGTDAKGGYAATVIFVLTLLAICLYVWLRETGIDRFAAGSGALMAAFLPAVTRLSLDAFLSQASILFVFPFFASLLQCRDLSARSFTLFFSLTLAYVVAVYSEIAPIGFCTLLLGVMFIRSEKFRSKRFMLMSAILLIALMNPFYLRNLIEFLGQQFFFATNAKILEHMAPKILTLRGWSELIFGPVTSSSFAVFFDYCALLLGLLFLAGAILLTRRDKLIFATVLLPAILVILFLASRTPVPAYPIAKITLTLLPFLIGLVFVALSRVPATHQNRPVGVLKKLICAMIVVAAAAGSVRYYSEVLNNDVDVLKYVREPRFQSVCRRLEEIKNKRVVVFETHPWLAPWLCYHARHNDVYYNGRFVSDSSSPRLDPLSMIPDLASVDFVATRDRIIDLKAPGAFCLTLVNDPSGEDRSDGQVRYWLGPPARLGFLALRPLSANLKLRLAAAPQTTAFPIDYFLANEQGYISQGEIRGETVDVGRMNFPKGISRLLLSVKARDRDPNTGPAPPFIAELDGLEITDIDLEPGG
jgi:hypothetical protein